MSEIMDIITSFINQMEHWPVAVAVCVALILLSHGLCCNQTFPNKWIWLVVGVIGTAIFAMIGDTSIVASTQRNPSCMLGLYGFIIAEFAVGFQAIAYRMLANKYPKLFNIQTDNPKPQDPPKV